MELLATHLAQWACSAAFPELAHCVLQELRRFAKTTNVERFRLAAKALMSALEESGSLVSARRTTAGFAPKDTAAVQVFMSKEDIDQDVSDQHHLPLTTTLSYMLCLEQLCNILSESLCLCTTMGISLAFLLYLHADWSTLRLNEACGWLQTPLHCYAKLLSLKARQQQALRRTGIVETDKAAGTEGACSSMDEEEDMKSGDIILHESEERKRPKKHPRPKESTKESPMRVRSCLKHLLVLCKTLQYSPCLTQAPTEQMMAIGDREDELNEYELSD